jgi:hypothetical protein
MFDKMLLSLLYFEGAYICQMMTVSSLIKSDEDQYRLIMSDGEQK